MNPEHKTGTAVTDLENPRLSRSHQENTSALSNLISLDKTNWGRKSSDGGWSTGWKRSATKSIRS